MAVPIVASLACPPGFKACGTSGCWLSTPGTTCSKMCTSRPRACALVCIGKDCRPPLSIPPASRPSTPPPPPRAPRPPPAARGAKGASAADPSDVGPWNLLPSKLRKPGYGSKVTIKGNIVYVSAAANNPGGSSMPMDLYVDVDAGNVVVDYNAGDQVTYKLRKQNGTFWAMYTHREQLQCSNYTDASDIGIYDSYAQKVLRIMNSTVGNHTWVFGGMTSSIAFWRMIIPNSVTYSLYANMSAGGDPLYLTRLDAGGESWFYEVTSFTRGVPDGVFVLPTICKGVRPGEVDSFYTRLYADRWKGSTLFVPTMDETQLPREYSLVTQGISWQVKNQLACGSCWAFATVASVESVWMRATGEPASLSEQYVNDCALSEAGCFGGMPGFGLAWATEHALPLNEEYGYVGINMNCNLASSPAAAGRTPIRISGFYRIAADEDMARKVKEAVYRFGAVAVLIDADCLKGYTSGVLTGNHFYATGMDPLWLNHAVNVVGWGVDAATNLTYWQVKNSWGPTWGEDGYFRLDTEFDCGLTSDDGSVAFLNALL